ncbi:MAG: thiamine-phosphate kinase [Labilithrix sp.]|nr:thiamine-phosphate kinase [Labilithrix sp.]
MNELERIALLRARFATASAAGVRVGIGDDAAVIDDGAGGSLVWTVDVQIEGTHFRAEWVSWRDVGWRSFMAAASDVAAMGADPAYALSSLALGPAIDDAAFEAIVTGQAEAAEEVGAPIIGGNLARAAETSITTTLLGRTPAPILRAGARPGDGLWLAGDVGLASAGLAVLERGSGNMHDARISRWLDAWRRPRARVAEGRAMRGVAHAAIDVSDGLARDGGHVAEVSDVQLVFDAEALESGLDGAIDLTGRAAIEHALFGGEDYALLAAADAPIVGFRRVGSVEAYAGGARTFLSRGGEREAIAPTGFDHFGG